MKSRIIINSRNRATQSDSPTDFKMKFLYPIETGDYTLKYAYFPNTMNNVNNNNNWFKVNNTKVSITNGSYSTQELLVTAINVALSTLNASNPSISLTASLHHHDARRDELAHFGYNFGDADDLLISQ